MADTLRNQVSDFAADGTLKLLFSKWNLPSSAETETIYQLIESQKRESLLTDGAGILALAFMGVICLVLRVRQKQQIADRANAAKSEFLASMSHEIGTPLNGVIGMAELLSQADLTGDEREMANTISGSAEVLLAVVNDILDFSKIEAGEMHVETLPYNPRETVRNILAMFHCRARAKGLDLMAKVADDVPVRLFGDAMRISQVLLNLVGNAIEFTEKGTVRLEVEMSRDAHQGQEISFRVADTGIGIRKEAIEKIFAPFVQEDSATTRKYGGTGLGLAISHRLVKLMGGAIRVKSEPGRGSDFQFSIPVGTPVEREAVTEETEHPSAAVPSLPITEARILIAEDNPVNQLVARRCLCRLGYNVVVVNNGVEALRALETSDFDLILMDCQMPEMDGYQAAAEIRRRESGHRRIPIIAMTANAFEEDKRKCLKSGMDGYLTKPVRLATLGQMLQQWLTAPRSESPAGSCRH